VHERCQRIARGSSRAGVWHQGSLLAVVLALAYGSTACAGRSRPDERPAGPARPNVLFIAVDDLRPEGGTFGPSPVKTPNIDALARRGTAFTRAYTQQALCSPSRTSLLTGRRPDATRIYDLQTHFRTTIPAVVTLPELFRRHGYHTEGLGKIYHDGLDDSQSWSVPHWMPTVPWREAYGKRETLEDVRRQRERLQAEGKPLEPVVLERDVRTGTVLKLGAGLGVRGPSWEDPDVSDETLPDGELATKAIAALRAIGARPFFLAIGFAKPHLPFVAPRKYYDLYPSERIQLAANPSPPQDVPAIAMHNSGELRQYPDVPNTGPIAEEQARALQRGYFASVSYVDAQIGRVLAELDRLGLRERTIVVLWGDHGWHLGEHGLWNKHTNFEVATRTPLIFSVPWQKSTGATTSALAELVDVYPTLCQLAGLPVPDDLEGTSLVPLLDDPGRAVKRAAFSQYPRPQQVMGYTIRTDQHRYTEWRTADGAVVAVELYDHQTDPQENVNLAGRAGSREVASQLSAQLKAGWRAARVIP
jgi:iduronate 2-sulfatase